MVFPKIFPNPEHYQLLSKLPRVSALKAEIWLDRDGQRATLDSAQELPFAVP